MENSKAYKYLSEQVNAMGARKMNGYYPKIMEEIYDWERNEVEDIIWETFHKNNDCDLAIFFPKLKNYNGIEELKKTLEKCKIPSENSVIIAKVLYENMYDSSYINIIRKNIEKDSNNETYVAMISYAKPSEDINPFDFKEMIGKTNLRKIFNKDSQMERKEVIKKLESGAYDKYKE